MKRISAARPRRIAVVALATVVSAVMLAALGGVNVAQGVSSIAQYAYGKQAASSAKKEFVCHKGRKTVHVGKAAVAAHVRHGDQVGTCAQVAAKKAAKLKAAKERAAKQKAAKEKAAKQQGKKQQTAVAAPSAGKSGGGNGKGHGKK